MAIPLGVMAFDANITVINTFTCPYSFEILGLEYIDGETAITFVDNHNDKLFTCNANDGTYIDEVDLNYTNPHPWGVCYDASGYAYVNDYSGSLIRWTDYSSWYSYANPSGNAGSGMDFDGTYIWEVYWTDGIYRFLPDGTVTGYYPISEISTQMSGMTLFPLGSNLGVMIATHGGDIFYFYRFNGTELTYLGSEPCPLTISQSRGLTYSTERGTFFWSYDYGGEDYISELGIDFTFDDVQPTSLGDIKAMFN